MAEPKSSPLPLGQARIAGRINGVRSASTASGKMFFSLLKLPAPDAYTSPATVEVRSGERIGSPGDEVSILVSIGGFARSFDRKDGSGSVATAENALSFVGHA